MLLRDFPAPISIGEFVQCFRIVDFNFSSSEQIPVKAYPPKPENCLHFFLRDKFSINNLAGARVMQPLILFSGQQTSLIKQNTGKNFLDVQVVFQPTAIFRLLGISSIEFANRFEDAELIFPKNIRFVWERLQEATTHGERLHIVEDFVIGLVANQKKDASPVDFMSRDMIKINFNTTVAMQATGSFLSGKQFKRNFSERVGINPKEYARIVRFNKVFNLRNRYPDKPWSNIASQYGFSDYQHLAKDYKEFTGMSPYQFHLLEKAAPENILGLAKDLYINRAKVNA